jgi:hypothetical protein
MASLAPAERSPGRDRARRDQKHRAAGQPDRALRRLGFAQALGIALALAACSDDDAAPPDSGIAVPDAARDAGPDEDSGSDEDGGADAGAGPEKIVGDDFVLYPELEPEADGELIVRFGIPNGARSFALTVVPRTARRVLLVSLHGPGDELLFDGLADEPTGPLAGAITHNVEPALPLSVLYPNTPEAPFGPGFYSARLYLDEIASDADPSASVDIVLGRPIDDAEPRVLGLQLWVASGASLTPDDIIADDTMLEAFGALRSIFERADITVPSFGLNELGVPEDQLAIVDSEAATLRVLDALADYPGRGVHVVFVDRIEAGEGKTVLGKTTGIPLPPPHDELARRGAVLIALETLPSDPERIAELIAHETSHALGLRHTSEAAGERHDPLLDTPECPSERATFETTSGALLLTAEDCEELGGDNLLFYTPPRTDFAQQTLTPDQAWVLARNPSLL